MAAELLSAKRQSIKADDAANAFFKQ